MKNYLKYARQLAILLKNSFVETKENWGHYIVATKRGLYEIKNKKVRLLHNGEFYGVTLYNKKLYVLKRLEEQKSQLITFPFENGIINKRDRQLFMDNLDWGAHQIDFIKDHFIVMDTFNNGIQKINTKAEIVDTYYPFGQLENGRTSPNYRHMNSVFSDGKMIYVVCHNETTKTKNPSEILLLNFNFEEQNIISTQAANAHNVILYKDAKYYCDSIHSTLMKDDTILLKTTYFTRGLSISDDFMVVGGSEYSTRKRRKFAKGALFFIDHQGQLLDSLTMPGMVQEIRRLDTVEYGLSSTYF